MTVIGSTLNLTKKEIARGQKIYRRITERSQQDVKYSLLENIAETPISDTYLQKRDQLLKSFSEFGVQNVALKQIKSAKTLRELFASMINFPKVLVKKTFPKYPASLAKKQSKPLQVEQEIYKYRNLRTDCVREINTIFSKKSTNPEVIKIENMLKEKYGVKKILFNDDMIVATKVLEAVKLAKSKGIKIPDEFIVTDFTLGGGECMRSFKNNKEITTVLLPHTNTKDLYLTKKYNILTDRMMPSNIKETLNRWKDFCGFKEHSSTSSPLHMEIHEMMHQTHPYLSAFVTKKVPAKFLPIVRKVSGYSAVNEKNNYEIYTELATKKVLEGLEPDEAELFKFLGGDI